MTREELIQARETARTGEEIIRAVARIEHANAHDGTACPDEAKRGKCGWDRPGAHHR